MSRIATRTVTDTLTGNTIRVPAHMVAKDRITDSDVREHGSFAAARAAKWATNNGAAR